MVSNLVLVIGALFMALRTQAGAEELQDSCVCNCCFDRSGNRDCINPSATTFLADKCTVCNVTSCATKFPRSCGLSIANITVDCVERTNWYLRLIPVIFMISTIALVFYGVFIKTFDGYHPIENTRDAENPFDRNRSPSTNANSSAALRQILTPTSYQATATTTATTTATAISPFERMQRHAVKVPSPLSQTAPLTAPTTPTATASTNANAKPFEFPNHEAENIEDMHNLDTKDQDNP